jgi:zinc protease
MVVSRIFVMVPPRGISLTDERRFALDIIQAILAGQGGRLFLELRDKASLAYTVSPIHMNGVEGGYFGAYIGCSPEKGAKAVQMLKDLRLLPQDLQIQLLPAACADLIFSL